MVKKIVFLIFPAMLAPLNLGAGWLRTYGGEYTDKGACVQETYDGGYIVTGSTDWIGDSCAKIWLLKVNSSGDTLWTRTYGSSFDQGFCVRQSEDGGYILATSLGLMKTNDSGVVQWTRPYPGNCVSVTSDGGYALVSWRNGHPWLLKTTSNGDTMWTREYDSLSELNYVGQTSDGGYVLAGRYAEIGLAARGYWLDHAWFLKTDSLGNGLWGIDIPGDAMTSGYSACETKDGGFVFGGVHEGYAATTDYLLLIKTDSEGSVVWQYDRDNNPMESRTARCVSPTDDSGCVVAGWDWFHLVKFKGDGDIEWSRLYSDVYEASWVLETEDEGYIATGYANPGDLVLLKTDADGETAGISSPPSSETPVTPVTPVTHQFEIANPIGREIVLRYSNCPSGFHASIFDASGRKVDELKSPSDAGVLVWGEDQNPGVYFIVPQGSQTPPLKVILVK